MYGDYQQIHFPFYKKEGETFLQCQQNLTDYCLSKTSAIAGRDVLEIGCGNGIQGIYMMQRFAPASYTGIDINRDNLEIAKQESEKFGLVNVRFIFDDAQKLSYLEDNTYDTVLNIESALHYPDKGAFLQQVFRVLKPGGHFLIADVLSRKTRSYGYWDSKMWHFNWSMEQYHEALRNSNLQLICAEDITPQIIEGFKQHRYWFKNSTAGNSLINRLIKYWAKFIFKLNISALQNKNCYVIFSGIKP